jgi:predicted nucleic acid-binding protein
VVELARVRFVVDENTLAIGKVMADLRGDTAYVGAAPIAELLPRRSADRQWIPIVAEHGWIVVTNDHRLRTRHFEAICGVRDSQRRPAGSTGLGRAPGAVMFSRAIAL